MGEYEVVELLNGGEPWIPLIVDRKQLLAQSSSYPVDFKDVKGQYQIRPPWRWRPRAGITS
jgi:hypothetical protein